MKVGDLVRWYAVQNDLSEKFEIESGIIIEFSKTGHDTLSALVLFEEGSMDWIETEALEVISESR